MDHILDAHHAYLKRELPRLAGLLDAAQEQSTSGSSTVARELRQVFVPLREEIEGHLMKEELVLFPLIRALEQAERDGTGAPFSHCGSVCNPIRVMEMEHANAIGALARLRLLTNGYAESPEDGDLLAPLYAGLEALDADLTEHIRLENDILHPRAAALEAGLQVPGAA